MAHCTSAEQYGSGSQATNDLMTNRWVWVYNYSDNDTFFSNINFTLDSSNVCLLYLHKMIKQTQLH